MLVEGQIAREVADASRALGRGVKDLKRNVHPPIDLTALTSIQRYINEQLRILRSLGQRGVEVVGSRLNEGETLLGCLEGYRIKAERFFSSTAEEARLQRPMDEVISEIKAIGQDATILKAVVIGYLKTLQQMFHDLLEGEVARPKF